MGSQSHLDTPTSQTPHSGAVTLLRQPHWCAGGGTERKSSSTAWLLSCAQHWPSCSENKGPEAPAEQRKAESSGFQSLLTVARVRNTLCISTQCTQDGCIYNKQRTFTHVPLNVFTREHFSFHAS